MKKEWRKIRTAYDQHYKSTKLNQFVEHSIQQKQNILSSEVHMEHSTGYTICKLQNKSQYI